MKSEPSENLQKWLRDFSRDQNAEASFKQMVAHLNPLIFQTAYRKSGNHELAKDVAQSVFLIIAKKAPTLTKHPTILGWVHETTRTETLRTMRSHARRQKREEAAMKHHERSAETNRELLEVLDESMKCLSASERELVLMKYFEDRTYQSITATTGRSESAEKMRLKRALEKMSNWLGRKGVALSITGLGSLLSAEMAKGAPVIAVNFTTAAASIPAENIVTQTLATIGPSKLALGTGLLVLAGAAQPISAAWKELQDIREAKVRIEQPISDSTRSRAQMTSGKTEAETVSGIVDGLTDVLKDKYGIDELSLKLIDAIEYRDQALLHELDQILAQFNVDDLADLARTLNARQQINPPNGAVEHLMKLLPQDWSPSSRIDWALAVGSDEGVVFSIFSSWFFHDGIAARKWLVQQTEAGTLEMTGVRNDPEGLLWDIMMRGVPDAEKGVFTAEVFLDLPKAKRRRLSNYRGYKIPRVLTGRKQGDKTAVQIIKGLDDSSERHWINALVNSEQAPKKRADFEQWLGQWNFNEIEHNWAMSFFKEEEKQ